MFIINWLFDKLGYMPKIDMEIGKVNLDVKPWPFPEVEVKNLAEAPKPIPKKKPVGRKPKVVAKTARTKKAK